MTASPIQGLLARHEAFLQRLPADRALIGHWHGGYFPAHQFPCGTRRWGDGEVLQPEDVAFPPFASDYAELHRLHEGADDDWFFVASAYWGIPWLEAILGCRIEATRFGCRAETGSDSERLGMGPGARSLNLDENRWFTALTQFTRELVEFADGRFPVCPPLLRGPGDAAAALLGGSEFVLGLVDDPARASALLEACTEVRMAVIRSVNAIIPSWHGTHAAGGYPSKVWCRRSVAYHQEDSAALLSPSLFREFLLPLHRRMCAVAEVNFIHLHSSCLYPVDILLDEQLYDVLEVNVDHAGAGPSLTELLPALQRIQAAGRALLLWGEFSPEDWALVRSELSPVGLSVQPIVEGSSQSLCEEGWEWKLRR